MDSKTMKRFGIAGILASALFTGSSLIYDLFDRKKALERLEVRSHDEPINLPEFGIHEKREYVASSWERKYLQREKQVGKSQDELYSGLFNVFLDCQKKGNYSSFLKDLMLIKKKNTWSFVEGRNSLDEIRAYLEDDKTFLLQQALFDGKFFDAAVLAGEFAVPEEVIRRLYEKGGQCKDGPWDAYWDIPYTEEHFDLRRYAFLRSYLDQAVRISSPQEGGYPIQIRERFLELVEENPGKVQLNEIQDFVQKYGLDAKDNVIVQEVEQRVKDYLSFFQKEKSFFSLEEIVAGYGVLGRKDLAEEQVRNSFADVFSLEYHKRVVDKGVERDGVTYLFFLDKVERNKDCLDGEIYRELSEKVVALREE